MDNYFKDFIKKSNFSKDLITLPISSMVITQGEKAFYCFILLEGTVKVFHNTSNGKNYLFGIYNEPQIFGHIELPNQNIFFNSVQCLTSCKLIKINRDNYLKMLKEDHEFSMKINFDLCSKLMNTSYRMVKESYFPLEYHIIKYIIEESNNLINKHIKINKSDLADYFGTNLRSINRILKKLTDHSIIKTDQDTLRIIDSDRLNATIKKFF